MKPPLESEVHAWIVSLHQSEERIHALFETLSEDERNRALRFHFERDRNNFTVARGALREILSLYLYTNPRAIRFRYSERGKPDLDMHDDHRWLRFNLSHSSELALIGLTCNREIGVDIERIRSDFAGLETAERFFSPRETESLRRLPAPIQTEAFFNCWTRKEAYIKALGEGVFRGLDSFHVSLGEKAAIIGDDLNPQAPARWSMTALEAPSGYKAAICVEGRESVLILHRWPE